MPTITEQIEARKRELKEQLAKLDEANVDKLLAKRKEHELAIASIDSQLAEIQTSLGIENKPARSRGGKPKKLGKLVSLDALKRYIQHPEQSEWIDGSALSIRKAGIDTDCVKQLVTANPDVFSYTPGTWPKVALKK